MGERCPIRGTSLYLVLKSNGLHRPENLPVKFGFRPKPFPRISPKSYRHNAVSNRFSLRFSTSRTNGPRLPSLRKRVHTRLSEKDRTQRLTRRNTGRFGWGWYHYSRSVPHVHQHPRAGYQNGKFCRFWGLVGDAPEERRKPTEQRCAYACRCPEGVAAPLGCVICLQLGDIAVFSLCAQYFLNVRGGGGITTLGAFHTVRKPCVAGV